ncbi:MAG: type II and III secretion system protein family protein [Pseudomonadota bacterium]
MTYTKAVGVRPSIGGFVLHLFAFAVVAITAGFFAIAAQAQTRSITIGDGNVDEFVIAPGFTVTIDTNIPFADIVVGNSNVADVFPLTESSLYIQGRASGFTNVALYDETSNLLGVIDVRVQQDFGELQTAINRAVPSACVSVANVNDRIRLSGEVKDSVDLGRVIQLAQQYTEEPVINAMRVRDAQQVQLDVRIIEVERNSARELGVGLSDDGGSNTFNTGAATDQGTFGNFVGNLLQFAGGDVDVVINALETRGLARRLANPTLITTSGVEANFVVGGEIPIEVSTTGENGNVSTATGYREYGVRLNFRPTVLDEGLISLRIQPEVSDIDPGLSVNGQPAFISRKADTTVSLRDGQSFAIAGLLQANNSRSVDQVPWLGQVPILGTLFRSTEFQKRESDLVILVTPRLVRPASPDEPLATPLDNTRSSTDVELFLLGMLEVDRNMIRAFRDGEGIAGPYGHLIDLEFEDGLLVDK